MRSSLPVALLVALVASTTTACRQPAPPTVLTADSVVLQREPCYGFCPVYRLRIDAQGRVVFLSLSRGDSGRVVRDSIAPSAFQALVRAIDSAGFDRLPASTRESPTFCALQATDHPSTAVTLARGGSARRVDDYLGCRATDGTAEARVLSRWRAMPDRIDSLVGVARWLDTLSHRR